MRAVNAEVEPGGHVLGGDPWDVFSQLVILIVEGRTPGGERGFHAGPHCLSTNNVGVNRHVCDQSVTACARADSYFRQLRLMWGAGVGVSVEVLVAPECEHGAATDTTTAPSSQLKLIEQWNFDIHYHSVSEARQGGWSLIAAVRSYLHFSQLAAWLSSSRGSKPENLLYRLTVTSFCSKFEKEFVEVEHVFPVANVGQDTAIKVTVRSLERCDKIPVVKCDHKHNTSRLQFQHPDGSPRSLEIEQPTSGVSYPCRSDSVPLIEDNAGDEGFSAYSQKCRFESNNSKVETDLRRSVMRARVSDSNRMSRSESPDTQLSESLLDPPNSSIRVPPKRFQSPSRSGSPSLETPEHILCRARAPNPSGQTTSTEQNTSYGRPVYPGEFTWTQTRHPTLLHSNGNRLPSLSQSQRSVVQITQGNVQIHSKFGDHSYVNTEAFSPVLNQRELKFETSHAYDNQMPVDVDRINLNSVQSSRSSFSQQPFYSDQTSNFNSVQTVSQYGLASQQGFDHSLQSSHIDHNYHSNIYQTPAVPIASIPVDQYQQKIPFVFPHDFNSQQCVLPAPQPFVWAAETSSAIPFQFQMFSQSHITDKHNVRQAFPQVSTESKNLRQSFPHVSIVPKNVGQNFSAATINTAAVQEYVLDSEDEAFENQSSEFPVELGKNTDNDVNENVEDNEGRKNLFIQIPQCSLPSTIDSELPSSWSQNSPVPRSSESQGTKRKGEINPENSPRNKRESPPHVYYARTARENDKISDINSKNSCQNDGAKLNNYDAMYLSEDKKDNNNIKESAVEDRNETQELFSDEPWPKCSQPGKHFCSISIEDLSDFGEKNQYNFDIVDRKTQAINIPKCQTLNHSGSFNKPKSADLNKPRFDLTPKETEEILRVLRQSAPVPPLRMDQYRISTPVIDQHRISTTPVRTYYSSVFDSEGKYVGMVEKGCKHCGKSSKNIVPKIADKKEEMNLFDENIGTEAWEKIGMTDAKKTCQNLNKNKSLIKNMNETSCHKCKLYSRYFSTPSKKKEKFSFSRDTRFKNPNCDSELYDELTDEDDSDVEILDGLCLDEDIRLVNEINNKKNDKKGAWNKVQSKEITDVININLENEKIFSKENISKSNDSKMNFKVIQAQTITQKPNSYKMKSQPTLNINNLQKHASQLLYTKLPNQYSSFKNESPQLKKKDIDFEDRKIIDAALSKVKRYLSFEGNETDKDMVSEDEKAGFKPLEVNIVTEPKKNLLKQVLKSSYSSLDKSLDAGTIPAPKQAEVETKFDCLKSESEEDKNEFIEELENLADLDSYEPFDEGDQEVQKLLQNENFITSNDDKKSLPGIPIPSVSEQANFRRSLDSAANLVFHYKTGLPLTSSPAPLRKGNSFDFDSSLNSIAAIRNAFRYEMCDIENENCTPDKNENFEQRRKEALSASAPATVTCSSLLGNFEECVLNGRLEPVSTVHGFSAEIAASGTFCPKHISKPVTVFFYTLCDNDQISSPYMGHINLGKKGYQIPSQGTVQVTLFNPLRTVVKMFVVMYDLSDMPPNSKTFLRQRTYNMPMDASGNHPDAQQWLRYLIHLRFASSKSGKIYLHTDIRMLILRKCDVDAATLHKTNVPYELRSFTHGPVNPKFSPRK